MGRGTGGKTSTSSGSLKRRGSGAPAASTIQDVSHNPQDILAHPQEQSRAEMIAALSDLGIPEADAQMAAQNICDCVKDSLEGTTLNANNFLQEMRKLIASSAEQIKEPGEFTKAQELFTALSPNIKGSDLALAVAKGEHLDYLREKGIYPRRFASFSPVEGELLPSILERSLDNVQASGGLTALSEDDRERYNYDYGKTWYIQDGQLVPEYESYNIQIDGQGALVEIERTPSEDPLGFQPEDPEWKGGLETDFEITSSRYPRKWNIKEGRWEDKELTSNGSVLSSSKMEKWGISVNTAENAEETIADPDYDGPVAALWSEGPANFHKDINISQKKIDKAGSLQQWAENQLEKEIKSYCQWENENPKTAAKMKKEAKRKRKKREKAQQAQYENVARAIECAAVVAARLAP